MIYIGDSGTSLGIFLKIRKSLGRSTLYNKSDEIQPGESGNPVGGIPVNSDDFQVGASSIIYTLGK
jgi:hypothetical protein